ncbi:MAG: hypothetical protein AAF447_12310 [Myxococcota bacterium]
MMSRLPLALAALQALAVVSGCAKPIEGTTIDDTPENREVVAFVESYRRAVEDRDVGALLRLTSEDYFDDNGTPTGEDDLDYGRLQEKLLAWSERVQDVRYDIKFRNVAYREGRIIVEVTYGGRFLTAAPDGEERWARRIANHRLVLQREDDGELRIVAGL